MPKASTGCIELQQSDALRNTSTTVWIYVKMPVGSIVGCATVTGLHTLAPSTLWRRFGTVSGLKRHEFFEYFSGLPKAFALGLSEPTQLASPIPLSKLRDMAGGFHPPQFFANVASDGPLLHVMSQALHGRPHKSPNLQRELELA
jgi:predicted transcriptional regulator